MEQDDGLGFDLDDLSDLGMDITSISAADFDDRGALPPQAYKQPARQKIVHPRCVSFASAKKVASTIFPLAPGERAHVVVPGTFVYGDLIEAFAVQHDALITDLWVMTLSLNMANIESLHNLRAGDYVRDMHLIVSDYWYANERGEHGLLQAVQDDLSCAEFQLSVTRSHGKVTLMQTAAGEYYVITGSANLRSTSTIENFVIENDRGLFEWHRDWLSKLEAQYFTYNEGINIHSRKTLPKGEQWQILDNTEALTPLDDALPMRVQTAAQQPQEGADFSSGEDKGPSNG